MASVVECRTPIRVASSRCHACTPEIASAAMTVAVVAFAGLDDGGPWTVREVAARDNDGGNVETP
jgi:hypothetical protein